MATSEALQTLWQHNVVHPLIEAIPKSEAPQVIWQLHVVHALIEQRVNSEALQTYWPSYAAEQGVVVARQALQITDTVPNMNILNG